MNYSTWKANVETHVLRLCGMESECLPDFNYRHCFEQHWTPLRTAKAALAAAKRF
jgi:hypothetical protein